MTYSTVVNFTFINKKTLNKIIKALIKNIGGIGNVSAQIPPINKPTGSVVELFLDPLKAISRHDMHILEQLHESLFIINERREIESNLLFDYNSDDFRTWHFVLRKGVLFHNLEELTASDAVASIRYVKSYYKNVFTIESMQILGRYTFSITLHKPLTILPNFLASIRFSIFYANFQNTRDLSHEMNGSFLVTKRNMCSILSGK